jgi:hypothetical protein
VLLVTISIMRLYYLLMLMSANSPEPAGGLVLAHGEC